MKKNMIIIVEMQVADVTLRDYIGPFYCEEELLAFAAKVKEQSGDKYKLIPRELVSPDYLERSNDSAS